MRICILGAGALGSLVGGYLAHSGQNVTLIGRKAHIDAVNNDGLRIFGTRGEYLIRDNLSAVTSADEAQGEFDYFILLVKAKDSDVALAWPTIAAWPQSCQFRPESVTTRTIV